jgi:hypothetical protein
MESVFHEASIRPGHAVGDRNALWAWSRNHWDPLRAMVANPTGGYAELGPFAGKHLIRETAWFALDALSHDETGIAVEALRTVLGRQYDRPGKPWHGTFPIFDHDPEPGDDAIMWLSYDPNWRQFVGVALALIIDQYADRLPTGVVKECEAATQRCVEGEPPGRIVASYSNPALMHAWLADWVGRRFGRPDWQAQGWALAAEIMALFDATGTLYEFNSPTYDGVNLMAATLWAASGEPLRAAGEQLVAALLDSLQFLYHPTLHNLCGPFTRTYGMDLASRITLYGLWRLVALSDETALPPLAGAVIEHSHDLFFSPLIEWAIDRSPQAFPPDSQVFPRQRTFDLNGGRRATALLDAEVMMGAECGGREGLVWDQYVPGSVHWREDGRICWLRVHAQQAQPVDCELVDGTLVVTPAGDARGAALITTNSLIEVAGSSYIKVGSHVTIRGRRPLDLRRVGDITVVTGDQSSAEPVVIALD